jgi:hypothetical protein
VSGSGPRADRHVVSRSEALGEVVEGSRSAGFGGVAAGVRSRQDRAGAMTSASRSAGVIQPSVCRGLPLSSAATASSSAWEKRLRSVRLGKYWRSSPLVFSFDPRCQGLRGSAEVGRRRGAVSVLFQRPPPEPGVTVSDHRALQ